MSANWSISRNSSDGSPVSDDLIPEEGTVRFAAGQVTAVIPINIVDDDVPEEAEAFLLKLLPDTVTGDAEVDEPMEVSSVDEVFDRPIVFILSCCVACKREREDIGRGLHLLVNIHSRCCACV